MRWSSGSACASAMVRRGVPLMMAWLMGFVLSFKAQAQVGADPVNAFGPSHEAPPAEVRLQQALEALTDLLLSARWTEATALIESSELDPADAMALHGFVLLRSNSPEPARAAFLRALHARPERLGIWLYVAQCSVSLGEAAPALDAYQRGLPAGRDVPAVWFLGAQIELLNGHHLRAWDVLEEAEHRFGPMPDADLLRTQILWEVGIRWAMVPWQFTQVDRAEACRWWRMARTQDESAGLPMQGHEEAPRAEEDPPLWGGTTGLWASACEPDLRSARSYSYRLPTLQGVGNTDPDDRIQRFARSGECERAVALGSVYDGQITDETQRWLDWCVSRQ